MIRVEAESKKTEKFGQVAISNCETEGKLGDLVQELSDLMVALQETLLTDILEPVKSEKAKKEIKEFYIKIVTERMRG